MHKQKGSLLVELAVVVAIITLIAAGTVVWMTQQAEKTKVKSLAVLMLSIQQGVQSLLDTHAFELLQSPSFTLEGISNLHQPTLQELKQLGFLAPSFPLNSTIKLILYREGTCPGEPCHIHGLIYSKHALLNKKQQVDMNAVAQWQSEAKGAGLVVQPASPTRFTGVQLVVEHQSLPAGIGFSEGMVALLASTDASIIDRGGLSPNKNPNFQTDVDVTGSLNTTDDLSVGRYLILPHTERLGEACSPTGAITRGVDGKGLMSCENERWIRTAATGEFSLETYKQMIQQYWKINIPDETPGGFFVTETYYYSYHCWVPNPLNIYRDGRGICDCAEPFRKRTIGSTPAVRDNYFKIGIERPYLNVYICV